MSISNYNNKGNTFTFKAGADFQYFKLKDFPQMIDQNVGKKIRGFFISHGRYGEGAVLVTDDCYINLPAHMTHKVKMIIEDPETIQQINEGRAGFQIYSFDNSNGGKSYSVRFIDMEPLPF